MYFFLLQSLDTYYGTDGVPVIVWSVREEERIYFHRQQTSSKSSRQSRSMKPAPEQVGILMASRVLVEGVKDPRGLVRPAADRMLVIFEKERKRRLDPAGVEEGPSTAPRTHACTTEGQEE